ncbi:hypothetical protein LX15_005184 [Streptoalloteichus tenebrarius]|uniref:Uncharacterized protein n=1 Tax=Streptoalloteichus tenebrarius (strain ATCC 17920 / DSM 40477 / JCM 4838 / CBS 697.72 / NBRC 16177 / NCIMB 11028 / NRRL B-12390 / A12253. 1 / ISP 5477) TaxID=1933 RepID=A0ABT1I150_STRSD|nr:hypothetical protein [Streptoalloteichus tenebrarius]MCP2261458.1 hypothetical protein [Streptoalloteichus tenebrarius]BFE99693.1 hypothetical protein GCM10020241_13690 [Streptoalloteichus tenebrarius]
MSDDLSPVVAATAHWLVRAYPSTGGAFAATLNEVQARQAATVAAWLRYPTTTDAGLLALVGPGGSARLDGLLGAEHAELPDEDYGWRTWVDEVVVSWAACLLADPGLASAAVAALADSAHFLGYEGAFARLTNPAPRDLQAAALLRHPDLLAPVAELHRDALLARLAEATNTDAPNTADAA